MNNKGYYKEDAWWVSPYNVLPEVRKAAGMPGKVEIHDATLRDGEQTPGVVFSKLDKLKIAEKLIETGVRRIEAGMPAVSQSDYEAIADIVRTFPEAKVFSFARAMRTDIDMAAECGATGVVIEVPIGYPKLLYQFHWSWEQVFEKSADTVNYARSQGLKTVFFPYDTTRSREEDFDSLVKAMMKDAPPDSIGIVDTMGCTLPDAVKYLVKHTRELTGDLPVEVHTHNDFGLAVANELAGVSAGAQVVHSCVNGLGERTGNAPLEELILSLNILLGTDNRYDLKKLSGLCSIVEELSGIPIHRNKPFGGKGNYLRESGIGADLVIEQPLAMFATDPSFFDRKGEIALGKKSGKLSVAYYLDQMGVVTDDETKGEILARVKALSQEQKRLLTNEEFYNILKSLGCI